jgi:hypothetical protein
VPEWWGLLVDGELIKVLHWRVGSRPTLADFDLAVPGGIDYEIAPLRGSSLH